MKNLFFISLIVSIMFSCNKKPTADFTTGDSGFMAGDVVHAFNLSENANSYKWVLPDGSISTNKNVDYNLPIDLDTCTLTFELTAYSKKEKKSQTLSKSINVGPAAGYVVFWKDATCSCGTATVTIGTSTVQVTANTTSAPFCFAAGAGSFFLRIGNYSYSATDGVNVWNGNITISKLNCLNVKLI